MPNMFVKIHIMAGNGLKLLEMAKKGLNKIRNGLEIE